MSQSEQFLASGAFKSVQPQKGRVDLKGCGTISLFKTYFSSMTVIIVKVVFISSVLTVSVFCHI